MLKLQTPSVPPVTTNAAPGSSLRTFLGRCAGLALVSGGVALTGAPAAAVQATVSAERIPTLSAEEKAILSHMSLEMLDDGTGNLVPTIRITGANVQIVNGMGATQTANSTGNLVVGYNEFGNPFGDARTGSHNIAFGEANSFSSFGGLVGTRWGTISAPFATVSGGMGNTAEGTYSSVSGGEFNTATGVSSAISGGAQNRALELSSSVSGGRGNRASGIESSVSGGSVNEANALLSSVSGGAGNRAEQAGSSISGGRFNSATGFYSSVSGGDTRTASSTFSWAAGGLLEPN